MAAPFHLTDHVYAHRGFWDGAGPAENSIASFEAAIAHGLGLEFDIRPTRDGGFAVFHDQTLDRMVGQEGRVEDIDLEDLLKLALRGNHRIPAFSELLAMWPHTLPLLTEMKVDGRTDPEWMGQKVGQMLQAYPGRAAAMSFSEAAVRALPSVIMRGQVVLESHAIGQAEFENTLNRAVSDRLNYVAVNIADVERARRVLPNDYPIAAWTVRSLDEVRIAVHENVAIIFEHLDPALVSAYALP